MRELSSLAGYFDNPRRSRNRRTRRDPRRRHRGRKKNETEGVAVHLCCEHHDTKELALWREPVVDLLPRGSTAIVEIIHESWSPHVESMESHVEITHVVLCGGATKPGLQPFLSLTYRRISDGGGWGECVETEVPVVLYSANLGFWCLGELRRTT